jgi:hypothetical protein
MSSRPLTVRTRAAAAEAEAEAEAGTGSRGESDDHALDCTAAAKKAGRPKPPKDCANKSLLLLLLLGLERRR